MRLNTAYSGSLRAQKLRPALVTSSPFKPHVGRRAGPTVLTTSVKPGNSKSPQDSSSSSNPIKNKTKQSLKAFPWAFHAANPEKLHGAHKPISLVVFSSFLLSFSLAATSTFQADSQYWLPVILGGALGAAYVVLNKAGIRYTWRQPEHRLNVVITGGTKGIGKALAREFLHAGDRVLIASRSQTDATAAAEKLSKETGVSLSDVVGVACDVSDAASVAHLAEAAATHLGTVDVWINNAGYSGSFKPFIEQSDEAIEQVVRTNLIGSLLAMKAAMKLMASQPGADFDTKTRRTYHIFNAEGAGSDGMATANYAAYGATKAGLAQLCKSMQHEVKYIAGAGAGSGGRGNKICIHNFSPGMVLTELLLEGATLENKRVFDILCDFPETVAAFLVPRIRSTVARGLSGHYIRYLTAFRVLGRFATAPFHLGRFFDAQGNPIFPPEEERLTGQHRKQTERLARRAARRSSGLGLAYSASLAAAYFILVMYQVAQAHVGG